MSQGLTDALDRGYRDWTYGDPLHRLCRLPFQRADRLRMRQDRGEALTLTITEQALIRAAKAYEALSSDELRLLLHFAAYMVISDPTIERVSNRPLTEED